MCRIGAPEHINLRRAVDATHWRPRAGHVRGGGACHDADDHVVRPVDAIRPRLLISVLARVHPSCRGRRMQNFTTASGFSFALIGCSLIIAIAPFLGCVVSITYSRVIQRNPPGVRSAPSTAKANFGEA